MKASSKRRACSKPPSTVRPLPVSTIFSKIIAREIPARIVHEDDLCLAFHDVNPQAPVHILIIPKKEIPRVASSAPADEPLLGHLLYVGQMVAMKEGLHDTGFRLVINNGPDGGETVPHLHVHLLGGRPLGWPPG
jgi:histidine triad (HIT) family protein